MLTSSMSTSIMDNVSPGMCSALFALVSYLWYVNQQWTGLGFYATFYITNMLFPYICALGNPKVAAHTHNDLECVLGGSRTMALQGQANPDGFGKNLHGDQSLMLSGSLAGWEQMGVGGTMSPLRFRIQSGCGCCYYVNTGRWCLCVSESLKCI